MVDEVGGVDRSPIGGDEAFEAHFVVQAMWIVENCKTLAFLRIVCEKPPILARVGNRPELDSLRAG